MEGAGEAAGEGREFIRSRWLRERKRDEVSLILTDAYTHTAFLGAGFTMHGTVIGIGHIQLRLRPRQHTNTNDGVGADNKK